MYLESLDELEQMVVELFPHVRNKEIALPMWPEHPFNEQHFQTKWYVVPIKDIRNLFVIFPLPDLQEYYRSAVTNMFFYLIYDFNGFGYMMKIYLLIFSLA